ncbi:MAG: hypothetical protein ACXVDA_00700, partial [Ktedonobacterales bacterium]
MSVVVGAARDGGLGGHRRGDRYGDHAWRPLVMRRPAIGPGQGDVGAAFVDKDELLWVELGDRLPPGSPRRLVAL